MARRLDWEDLMEIYPGIDIDGLSEEAHHHGGVLLKFWQKMMRNDDDARIMLFYTVVYFVNTDNFFDGAEGDIFEYAFGDQQLYYDGLASYRRNNGEALVESAISHMSPDVKESFLRLGCCFFGAKGHMRDEEKAKIRRLTR